MGRLRLRGPRIGGARRVVGVWIAAGVATAGAASAQPPTLGTVSIHERTTQPIELVVDGVDCCAAPWHGALEPGKHDVFGRSGTLTTARYTFVVAAGGSTDVELVATPRAPSGRPLPPLPPPPPAEAPATPETASDTGLYGGLLLQLLLEPGGSHTDVCSQPFVTACKVGAPLGGGLMGYFGYTAGPIGVDALLGLQADATSLNAKIQTVTLSGSVPRLAFLGALRAHLAWHGPAVGASLAPGVGFAYRDIGFIGSSAKSVSYVAAAATLEAALHLRVGGSAMLSLGLMFWGENAGNGATIQVPPLTAPVHAVRTTQVFLLPEVGLEFGP